MRRYLPVGRLASGSWRGSSGIFGATSVADCLAGSSGKFRFGQKWWESRCRKRLACGVGDSRSWQLGDRCLFGRRCCQTSRRWWSSLLSIGFLEQAGLPDYLMARSFSQRGHRPPWDTSTAAPASPPLHSPWQPCSWADGWSACSLSFVSNLSEDPRKSPSWQSEWLFSIPYPSPLLQTHRQWASPFRFA